MSLTSVLIANRGEIAIRIARACAELGVESVAVHSADDATSLHVRRADRAVALAGVGPAAYLDIEGLIAAAQASGADAVHPGYGFLSERAPFATACASAGLVFVGPSPETIGLLGDKARARALAAGQHVAVLPGTAGPTTLAEADAFFAGLQREMGADRAAVMVKAVAGGGGRGMRAVLARSDLPAAFEQCRAEALASFGSADLYVERLLTRCRHLEVQVLGDATGHVVSLGERECSLQRRGQKLVEIAPCPGLPDALRARLDAAALALARAAGYRSAGTFEFLVDGVTLHPDSEPWFIEANTRLQVEHTVTEEVTGVDLVAAQLRLAGGETLSGLGLSVRPTPRQGFSVQLRVNTERVGEGGAPLPAGGVITAIELPGGAGIRVDATGYAGYETNPRFDSLLAKVVVSTGGGWHDLLRKAGRALAEVRVGGVATNTPFLRALLAHPLVAAGETHTTFIHEHAEALRAHAASLPDEQLPGTQLAGTPLPDTPLRDTPLAGDPPSAEPVNPAGAGTGDPLAVLMHGRAARPVAAKPGGDDLAGGTGDGSWTLVPAEMPGTIVRVEVQRGDVVRRGQALLVLESMKMHHNVESPIGAQVDSLAVTAGDTVREGQVLVRLVPIDAGDAITADEGIDLDRIRPDLAEVLARQARTRDEHRPEAVSRRRKTGQRTARENVDDLCDPGTFVEYGSLVIAAQRRRRSVEELIERTPADGMIAGVGCVNSAEFGDERARCAIAAYDYTVLAGTQGRQNHRKKDRLFELAARFRLPVVVFTEGGGGRPGDTEGLVNHGLDGPAFARYAALSGLVPLVAVNSGRCFAGNAALVGMSDVVIATQNSSIGMGGPAMIEGGGLGVFHPDEVGPMEVQVPNGVVDVAVADEGEAVAVAKKYLAYFQGSLPSWTCADQRVLRHVIPENRLQVYDVRRVVDGLADTGSVLELRRGFGPGMVTALARVEGRPLGIIANNPMHLAGAIDSDGADKAARFLQLCDAFDLPVLFLCDTPGMMVGPAVERTALVRHCSRLFVVGASLSVPFVTIVLRKAYGLGAQAMAGGSFHQPFASVSWPTGEFGGMGLEGAVKLGYRNELAAVPSTEERKALFDQMVARMYESGKALSEASYFEIDDVIDPADSRKVILRALRAAPPPIARSGKKRPCVDPW